MQFEKKCPRKLSCVTKQKPDLKQTVKGGNVPAPPNKVYKEGRVPEQGVRALQVAQRSPVNEVP